MKTFTPIFLFLLLICLKGTSQPVVTSFIPTSAIIGATITISGANFSTTPTNNIVRFGNVTGLVISATDTLLKVTVPLGASYGQITVSVNNLTGYSSGFFTPSFTSCTNGKLTFGSPIDSVFYNANPFVARDYDGDGRVDMANIFDSLYVKLNTSKSGLFSGGTLIQYNSIGSNATYLTDGDLNGDGKLDILSAVGDTIFILKNESTPGNVSFVKTSFTTSFQAGNAVVADIDGDGKPDIIIADSNVRDSVLAIFKNIGSNGNIAFAVEKDFNTSIIGINNLRVADIDCDGKPDIVVSDGYVGLWVLKNTTTNNVITLDVPVELSLATQDGTQINIVQIELGDFDGDGKTDIAIGSSGINFETYVIGCYVLKNTSTNKNILFDTPRGNLDYIGGNSGTQNAGFYGFAITDIDGDGKPDFLFSTSFTPVVGLSPTFYLLKAGINNCTFDTISFKNFNYLGLTAPVNHIQVADMDGDGKPDIICGSQIFFSSCTLPVVLIDFAAKPSDKQIAVNWLTATELNTSHFIIQHSTNGTSFTDIGTVKAIGSGANKYGFTDNKPANGINYYRLKIVDKDGSVTYSKTVSALLTIHDSRFTVYPNPAKEKVIINGSHISSVQVIDNVGRVVKVVTLKDATNPTLSVSGLPAGVYHLRVQTTDGGVSALGMIKE